MLMNIILTSVMVPIRTPVLYLANYVKYVSMYYILQQTSSTRMLVNCARCIKTKLIKI